MNAASHYAKQGHTVTVLDSFLRRDTQENVAGLLPEHPNVRIVVADIRADWDILAIEVASCDVLLHLAAQVAVTTSFTDPRTDFEIDALGTLNLLESARQSAHPPIVLYSSTNKVYGGMEHVAVFENGNRYAYASLPYGVDQDQPLDSHSPYGCCKGTADEYVRDDARIYGLRTVVFRPSYIYGPHQFGIEDQGWVARFTLCSLLGLPVTIYGDGKQVPHVLYAGDLIEVFGTAIEQINQVAGRVYNIGGGPANTLSLRELIDLVEMITGSKANHSFSEWRPSSQEVYISDVRPAQRYLGWSPLTSPQQGSKRMLARMTASRETILGIYRN